MKLTLRVDQGDGPYTVSTNLWVITQWERRFKRKASDMAQGIGVEDLAFMAHAASQLHGITVPVELDGFIKKLVALDVIEEEAPVPTEAAPGADH